MYYFGRGFKSHQLHKKPNSNYGLIAIKKTHLKPVFSVITIQSLL